MSDGCIHFNIILKKVNFNSIIKDITNLFI